MGLLYSSGEGLAAARAWVSPAPDADELAALTGQEAPKGVAATGDEDGGGARLERVVVLTPLWPRLDLFIRCQRMWRYPAPGYPPLGLDWVQVRVFAEALEVPWNAETVDLMQAMEDAASAVWTEKWKRKHPPG